MPEKGDDLRRSVDREMEVFRVKDGQVAKLADKAFLSIGLACKHTRRELNSIYI